ncbi:hypothetical protein [Peribacillus butanolivorans]|uniref:Uncharacterized protein n=1 Tax=Peribacillus butanolivorans TaxID=421767 RepID=A0ABN5N2Z8_9BACI|nr:hypothetical protein [Peribacillus butanolivorans]AXN39843.1 hypothetical protein DTO10_16740 [Peribacillus butanolivorans]
MIMKRARDFFYGTGNMTKKFTGEREELVVINDGSADLTFTAGKYTTWIVKPGEVFDERITEFESITITSTGSYRGYVRKDA